MYKLYDMKDLKSLQRNKWDIPEPTQEYNDGSNVITREEAGM